MMMNDKQPRGFLEGPPTTNLPAPCDVSSIQERLTKLGGVMDDGRPKIRIVWGQDPDVTVFWQGKQRIKYLYKTEFELEGYRATYYNRDGTIKKIKFYKPSTTPPQDKKALIVEAQYKTYDIGIPRWFIEQIMPAEILCIDHDEIRFDIDSETKELIDSMGPRPASGDYAEGFYMITSHDDCCQGETFEIGCKGKYRHPDGRDYAYVEWLMRQLNDEPFKYNWNAVPPPEVVVQALNDRKTQLENEKIKRVEENRYLIKNALMPHRNRIFGEGRLTYHDLGSAFNKARQY